MHDTMRVISTSLVLLLLLLALPVPGRAQDRDDRQPDRRGVSSVHSDHAGPAVGGPVLTSAPQGPLQSASYTFEEFANAAFPPGGWTLQFTGTNRWSRELPSGFGLGSGSARFAFFSASAGTTQSLLSPVFSATGAGENLTFDHAYATYDTEVDKLRIETSPDGSTFTLLVELTGGTAGTMTTAPATHSSFVPTAVQWASKQYALPVGTVQVKFIAISGHGNQLYLDNIEIGIQPEKDAASFSVDLPDAVAAESQTPQATVRNLGSQTASFSVTMAIEPGGYSSTKSVTDLASNQTQQVTFDAWTPAAGPHTVTVTTDLDGDEDPGNDELAADVQVYSLLETEGWSKRTAMPAGRWAQATVSYTPPDAPEGTAYLYAISGYDAAFANTTALSRYDAVARTWQNLAPLPTARGQVGAVRIGKKIYVPGGYAGSFSPTTTLSIYDIDTDTWSTGATLPQATGDYAIGMYADSLIYVIGGYSGSADLNTVQIYNVNTDSWSSGTAKPGAAAAGLRAGIVGNTIVVAGGYNQTLSRSLDAAYIGTIDPVNPSLITWETTTYPGGAVGRHAAGTPVDAGGDADAPGWRYVLFTGGDPDGQGTQVLSETWAYDVEAETWKKGPDKLSAVSNIMNVAPIVLGDSVHLAVLGGYNGTSVISVNEWLTLGPLDPNDPPVADAGDDQDIPCAALTGNEVALDGSGSSDPDEDDTLTFTWTGPFAEGSGSTTGETPTVTLPAGTHTIALLVEDGQGGSARDTVVVTLTADATAPLITAKKTLVLSPADGKLKTITMKNAVASVSDACALRLRPSDVFVTKVTSDEPWGLPDAPSTQPQGSKDIFVKKGCQSVQVRAEEHGRGQGTERNGRVYRLHLAAVDAAGNVGEGTFEVHVLPRQDTRVKNAVDDGPVYEAEGCSLTEELLASVMQGQQAASEEEEGGEDAGSGVLAAAEVPAAYALGANYPNPFNPETVVPFELPEASQVVIRVYDVLGREMALLAQGAYEAGRHEARWRAEGAPSGLYLVRMEAAGRAYTRMVMLMK